MNINLDDFRKLDNKTIKEKYTPNELNQIMKKVLLLAKKKRVTLQGPNKKNQNLEKKKETDQQKSKQQREERQRTIKNFQNKVKRLDKKIADLEKLMVKCKGYMSNQEEVLKKMKKTKTKQEMILLCDNLETLLAKSYTERNKVKSDIEKVKNGTYKKPSTKKVRFNDVVEIRYF